MGSGNASWVLYVIAKAFGLSFAEVNQLPNVIADDPESDVKLKEIEDTFADWFIDSTKDMTKNVKVSDIEFHVKLSFETTTPSVTT